jgi:hypothetical protein
MSETYKSLQLAVGANDPRSTVQLLHKLSVQIASAERSDQATRFKMPDQPKGPWTTLVERRLDNIYKHHIPAPLTKITDINELPIISFIVTPSPLMYEKRRYMLTEPTDQITEEAMITLQTPTHWQAVESKKPVIALPSIVSTLLNSFTYHRMRERGTLRELRDTYFRLRETDNTFRVAVRRLFDEQYHPYEIRPPFKGEYLEEWRGSEPVPPEQEVREVNVRELNEVFVNLGVYSVGTLDRLKENMNITKGYEGSRHYIYRYLVPIVARGQTEPLT